jgi:hypothetical protein
MSSQLQVSGEAKIRDIQGPVVANSGVITALDGAASQYVRGDGTLADFPTSSGGGSSVSYYLNSSVSQGTIGGVAYRELSKEPIIGAGTDIAISANGYVANYLTDANDPDVLSVPGGNFNCEFYFSVNNNTGNPTTYAELYKYDGTTFTLLGSNVGVPESINQGTTIAPYYFAIPVATAALALTDRLAIRIYVNVSGRTVTLHTENGHLCQVVTTLSKGMVSLNNLTDQSQFLTTGTAGTNFAIASSGDTHTFNLPVASATNTGKLSSTDWSTFNNKQNTITDPITGTGASTQIAYFNSGTSITSEAAFNYDASTNRLGVNTSVPNATIGANAATDSGYSLLLKNDNANYNSIGFATDSTYGNMITADRLGAAPSRNLTLYNYAGFISITEAGNLGIGLLTPNNGIDIYHATQSQLWLHNNATGVTSTDGVRLALFNSKAANLRNFDGAMSISSEGDFSVITLGAENIRVNSVDGKVAIGAPATVPEMLTVNGSIQQSGVLSSLLKTNGDGKLIAAVAGTDYLAPSALSGYVPTSRTITINGTTQDLSANISYSVGTMGGSGVAGRVAYYNGTNSITSEAAFNYDDNLNRFGVNTNSPNATIGANANLDSGYSLLLKNSDTNYSGIGFATSSVYGNTIETVRIGSAPLRNLTLYNYAGYVSLTEAGNLGVGILTPNTGIDIYHSTISSLWLHTAASGTSGTDGVRLSLNSSNNAVLRNFEGSLSMSSESDFYVITLGAENIRVNSANGYVGIGNPSTVLALLHVYRAENAADLLVQTNSITDYAEIAARNYNSVSTTYYRQYSSSASGTDFGLSRSNLASLFSNYASNFAIGTMNGGALILGTANTARLTIAANGESTFSSSVTATATVTVSGANQNSIYLNQNAGGTSSGYLIGRSLGGANTQDFFIYDVAAAVTRLAISTTGAATFSSSVGIGNSPSSWVTVLASQVLNASLYGFSNNVGGISANAYYNSGWKYIATASATRYELTDGNHIWYSDASGTAGTNIANTERMRITSGGNVGIGTSSPTALDGARGLVISGGAIADVQIRLQNNITGSTSADGALLSIANSELYLWNYENANTIFGTNNTERMRITSGGNVCIGLTASNLRLGVRGADTGSSNFTFYADNGANLLFSVRNDGQIATSLGTGTVYSTAGILSVVSDMRLKIEDGYIENALQKVLNLKPRYFHWKHESNLPIDLRQLGFYAQEVNLALGEEAANTPKENVNWGINDRAIIAFLTAAIQEQQAQIEELKALINK